MEIISEEGNSLTELKDSTFRRLSGKLDAAPERVLCEIPIGIMQEGSTHKEQNSISPESRMMKENESLLFQHNIKPIFRRTRKSGVQHQVTAGTETKKCKLSAGKFSLGLSLGSSAKVSVNDKLKENVALNALPDGKSKSLKNVRCTSKILTSPAVPVLESTCNKPHCDGISFSKDHLKISDTIEIAENVTPSRCSTLLEAERDNQASISEPYNSPKPLNFSTATVEELGITPAVFTSTSAEKGKSPASLRKLRRLSTVGLRGSPETNCLIRYMAQQRSLALGSPLSPDFMYRSRDNSALKEKIHAFRRSFQSVDENERPALTHDHLEAHEPEKGFQEMPLSEFKAFPVNQHENCTDLAVEPPLKKKRFFQEEDSRSNMISISLPRSVTYWNGGETPVRSSLLSTPSQYFPVKKTPLFVNGGTEEQICSISQHGKENVQPQIPLQKMNPTNILKSDSKMKSCEEQLEKAVNTCTLTNSEHRRVKKVTFAGELKPELFDEMLPPNTPLCKGGTPARQVHSSGSLRPALKKTPLRPLLTQKEESPAEFCRGRAAFVKERSKAIPFPDLSEEAEMEYLGDANTLGKSTEEQESTKSYQLSESSMQRKVAFVTDLTPELFDKMLPPNTPLRKGGTPVRPQTPVHPPVPVSSSPCPVLKKTPVNDDPFGQPSFDMSDEFLESSVKETVSVTSGHSGDKMSSVDQTSVHPATISGSSYRLSSIPSQTEMALVETPSAAAQSSDCVCGPTADYPSLSDCTSPSIAKSFGNDLATELLVSQRKPFDVPEATAVETAGASDEIEASELEKLPDSSGVSQEDQPRLRLRRKCAEQASSGNSSSSEKYKSDAAARTKKISIPASKKSQASKRNGKRTRKGKRSRTRQQIYGAREYASKKPILSPIVEIPETLSPALSDTPHDQKVVTKGKVLVTPYHSGKHPNSARSKCVTNVASEAFSSVKVKAYIKNASRKSQKYSAKHDIKTLQTDQESFQENTLDIPKCPDTKHEVSGKLAVLEKTEDVIHSEHPSSEMTSHHENKKGSSRRSLALCKLVSRENVQMREALGAVPDLERVRTVEDNSKSDSVPFENEVPTKMYSEVVEKLGCEEQMILVDKSEHAFTSCSADTAENVGKKKQLKRRSFKPSEMVSVAEFTQKSAETRISLEANGSHAVTAFVSEGAKNIALNIEETQNLASCFSPKMGLKKGKRRSSLLTKLPLIGLEEIKEVKSSLQDGHITTLEVESTHNIKESCRKPSGRRRSSIENKSAQCVSVTTNKSVCSGDLEDACLSFEQRTDDQPYASSIISSYGSSQVSQQSVSAPEKRKVRRSMRLRRESDIIGLDWIQSTPSKTDDSESSLEIVCHKSKRRSLCLSTVQESECMTKFRKNRRASLVLQNTSCESKNIRDESVFKTFAL